MSTYTYDALHQDGDPVEVDAVLANDNYCLATNTLEGGAPALMPDADFLSGEHDESFYGLLDTTDTTGRTGRKRGPKVEDPPFVEGQSVYDRLVACELLRKLTDIVLAKVDMPWHLREDGVQAIHEAWCLLPAKPEFVRNQMARYAYMSGQHAALKQRRSIGAVVAIPGALFRNGRQSAFMNSIGAAVNPMDVSEFQDSMALATDPEDQVSIPDSCEKSFLDRRLAGLGLTKSQKLVAELACVKRMSAESIAIQTGMRKSYVERLIAQIISQLSARDDYHMNRPRGNRKIH